MKSRRWCSGIVVAAVAIVGDLIRVAMVFRCPLHSRTFGVKMNEIIMSSINVKMASINAKMSPINQ